MLLTSILCVPFVVGLACLLARPRGLVESLNIAGFVSVLVLGILVFRIRETFASMDVSKLNELKW